MDLTQFNQLIRAPWTQTTHRGVDYTETSADPLPKPVCEVFSGGLGTGGADAAQALIGNAPRLLGDVNAAFLEIRALHAAFGAPGDYGYETRKGKALWRIYRFQSQLLETLRAAGVDQITERGTQ